MEERDLKTQVAVTLARYEKAMAKNPLYDSGVRFVAFENRVTYNLDAVRDALPSLQDTAFEPRVTAVACALGENVHDVPAQNHVSQIAEDLARGGAPEMEGLVTPEGYWEKHRLALVLRCAGRLEEAGSWCRQAHRRLGEHWFNHLLMGDNYLVAGELKKAQLFYLKAASGNPDYLPARESVAETAIPEEQGRR